MLRKLIIVVLGLFFTVSVVMAAEMPLPDPDKEARAYALFHEIRCSVCQSHSLADSPADGAAEIRNVIRQRVAAGDSNDEIKDYLAAHYGDAVLMRPPIKPVTVALWFGPLVLLVIVLALAFFFLKKHDPSAPR